jgi:tetratricopeptide (TPR) repeat protein
MAVLKNTRGEFREGLALARSAQQFAAMVGNFRYETQGMKEEARAWVGLGNLAYGIEMCGQARKLVAAAGLEGSPAELTLLDFEEDIQLKKTDYPASRAINEIIVRSTSVDNLVLFHANSLANIISIDVKLGVLTSEDAVTAGLERTRQLFTSRGYVYGFSMCDRIVADVLASSGKKFAAREMYEECIRKARGASAAVVSTSLQKLGDIRLGLCDLSSTVRWATVYFAFAKNTGSVLYIAWALRLLGDISRNQGDDETASTLLQVALDEFTRMEIYQGRGECLLGLADIADQRGDRAVTLEYFSEARDMFEKSGLPFTLESSMFRT